MALDMPSEEFNQHVREALEIGRRAKEGIPNAESLLKMNERLQKLCDKQTDFIIFLIENMRDMYKAQEAAHTKLIDEALLRTRQLRQETGTV